MKLKEERVDVLIHGIHETPKLNDIEAFTPVLKDNTWHIETLLTSGGFGFYIATNEEAPETCSTKQRSQEYCDDLTVPLDIINKNTNKDLLNELRLNR